jgi:hypothetical protein
MSEINFDGINQAAARDYRSLLPKLIPGGKFRGPEYVAKNPRRNDQHPGSFSINFKTGVWKDFANGDHGSDFVSLVAHVRNISQGDAARELADKLGVPFLKSNGPNGSIKHNGPKPSDTQRGAPAFDAPRIYPWGDDGPPVRAGEMRRHLYRDNGAVVRIKIKRADGGFINWFRVRAGWQAKKPDDYRPVPYVTDDIDPFNPGLIADDIFWTEGEKDVDTLNRLNLPAFTFGGVGDGLPGDIGHYLKDRHLVVPADNDQPGRDHAEKKAALAHSMGAASIKIVHFPELPEKNDVSDFIEGGGTAEQLVDRATRALLWRPDASASNCESDAETPEIDDRSETDAEIKRLAKLTLLEYERERKSTAVKLGIRVDVLDRVVNAARGENGDTKGQGRSLELPTILPWPEPINGAYLLDDICNAVKRYLVLPEGGAEVLAFWATHTHALECFGHSPRLAITSPEKQCGKTLTLDVLGELVGRPLPTSNATTAAIFRTIEIAKPTLLIDEADTFLGENEGLRGVLNSGHGRGGHILRTVGDDHEPRQFATWAPAAIAMIGRLPDTLEDRSVSIALRRRRPTEKVQQFRSDRVQDLKQLSRKIARWCDDNRQSLAAADPKTRVLTNRAADNWRPLLSIADLAGGPWPERARTVAEAAETAKRDQSKRTMVLGDIRDIFAARPGTDRLRSAEMAETLGAMENRPWSEWRNGKPITPAALARLLAPFEITPGTKRDGEATFKGYLLSDFREAFATYLPDQTVTPSQPNNDGHCDGLQSVTPENDVTVSKCSKPNNDRHCDGVTVLNREKVAEEDRLRQCAQCKADDDGKLQFYLDAPNVSLGVWLHRECKPFYFGER